MNNKFKALTQIFRGFLLSFLTVMAFTNVTLSQDKSFIYSLFIGINSATHPKGFDNYYLDGFSGGGMIEKPINTDWSTGLKTEYARYYPDISAVTEWQSKVAVDFIPSGAKYHVNSYAVTGVLRRQLGNPKQDMRYFTEFELGPHLFTGGGWDSVPRGLRQEVKVSVNEVQIGVGIGVGIKWDWDGKNATFVQVGWHKILNSPDSKSYIPLMAGIKF